MTPRMQPTWVRYGYGVVAVALALGAAVLLRSFDLEGFLFVIAVAATVWFGGRGPGIVAVGLSVLVIDYFFLSAADFTTVVPAHVGYFILFVVLTLLITMLSETRHRSERALLRSREQLEAKVQERTAALQMANTQLRDEIAERRRGEEEIRRQAALLDLAHDAIIVRDRDDHILFWNRGAEEVYGWSAAEVHGRATHELLRSVFPEPLEVLSAFVEEHGTWEGELTHVRRDGETIVVASRWSRQRGEDGKTVAIMEINRDVTDRKQAEEALRSAESALARVSRVTTLGEVTASFAHELNQPLAAIVNNANACLGILPDGPEREEVRAALSDIVGDAERASAIIERVRALARRSASERVPVRLADVVQDVVSLTASESAARGVHLRTDVARDLPSVPGDRVQLQQVLLNLIVNAMDAMGATSGDRVLVIRARQHALDGHPSTTVSVEDRGVGLQDVDMDRLFEAFYTTKPNGMGMGLAISRSIIEAHRGRLWAERNASGGATFSFTLPVADT